MANYFRMWGHFTKVLVFWAFPTFHQMIFSPNSSFRIYLILFLKSILIWNLSIIISMSVEIETGDGDLF
jgi:hypothetical protein